MLTLSYDIETALDPIAQVASDAPLIVSNKNVPANNLVELVEWLKASAARPADAGEARFAS